MAASRIELSESALRKNVRFLRRQIGSQAAFCSVIKGNAYGHGITAFLPLAERCGVDRFAVFDASEALIAHRCLSPASSLMIMGFIDDDELEWAVENDIAFYVFDMERLERAVTVGRLAQHPARVHLELETGLNRTGLQGDELDRAVDLISKSDPAHLQIEGLCTHYAGAESVGNYLRIRNQIAKFNTACAQLCSGGVRPTMRHSACSAAALGYPETVMDMVRFGIAHYGFWPSPESRMQHFLKMGEDRAVHMRDPLRRVMRWTSRVMSVKTVGPGEFVGYGISYMTRRRQRIAGVPVGYYHGFSRGLSNLGHVLIRGRRAPVVGIVNMNMMLVDVTDHWDIARGDEVVLIGRQGKSQITVRSFSDLSNFLNYEVLVRLPADIPRVVVK